MKVYYDASTDPVMFVDAAEYDETPLWDDWYDIPDEMYERYSATLERLHRMEQEILDYLAPEMAKRHNIRQEELARRLKENWANEFGDVDQ